MYTIIVDIQPAYDKYCKHIVPKVCDYINSAEDTILILYNGPDLGLDTVTDVQNYYLEYGMDYDKLNDPKVIWREKIYGYFRDAMDTNYVGDEDLIKIIKLMINNNTSDSRELNDIIKEEVYNKYNVILNESNIVLTIPDIKEIEDIKNSCYIMGGGKDECLKEIFLFVEAHDIKCIELKEMLY